MDSQNLPRVLIIGTVPYNKNSTSRAFDAYFHNWPKEKLAQIFSINKAPTKGHCKYFFQITDQRMLKRHFSKKVKTGKVYLDEELETEWKDNLLETKSSFYSRLYKRGSKKTPFIFLMRKWLWNEKYWYTKELHDWVTKFNPQVIFLSFSDDFFIPEIAMFMAKKFNIPIVSSTGDDYIFNNHFSLSPFYYIYRRKYKKLISKVMAHPGNIIYIGDKIRDKYNDYYHRHGETIYLSSELKLIDQPASNNPPVFSYFGNIRNGRNESLKVIADTLQKINGDYKINIYTSERDNKFLKILKNHPGINLKGNIPYSQVAVETANSNYLIVVEGMKKKDILTTKYSLSTKAADCLASGIPTIAYGSIECGLISYLESTNAVCTITKKEDLFPKIKEFIENEELQKECLENAKIITKQNHTLSNSNAQFERIVCDAYKEFNEVNKSSEISLLIQSCNAFSDIWDAHVTLMEKNFKDRNMETYLVSDRKNDMSFEHVHVLFAGEGKEYSERLSYALDRIDTEYVLLTLDDYLLTKKIKTQRLYEILDIMKKENYAYVRFFHNPGTRGKKKTKYPKMYFLDPIEQYDINLYPGIWKTSVLREMITEQQNAWQFEVSLSKKIANTNYTCVMTKEKVFPILDGIRKGQLLIKSNSYLKKHHMYFGSRKRIKWVTTTKLMFREYLKKLLPKKLVRKLKNHMKKKGYTFYSD
ncbi:MAG: hypothetical protein J1F31_05715 [Erysipelotrichales bacterium]|nr:hypothetical protein [Erysipelotrichales bacterium]